MKNSPVSDASAGATQPKKASNSRFWEIDTWRGVAVITMIIYHLSWDLWFFGAASGLDPFHGWLKLLQRFTASSFIILAGLSVAIANQRLERSGAEPRTIFRYFLRHGLIIFGWGMLITLVMAFSGVGYVHFGVLHLIGFSIIAAYPFRRLRWVNIALWAILWIAGNFVDSVRVDTLWLTWLGFHPARYFPVDYFPVIPWFGVALLGVGLGNLLYTADGLIFTLPNAADRPLVRGLRFLGSHSLTIYLIHQPILFAILWLLGIAG